MSESIGILGPGAFGLALANSLARDKQKILLWGRSKKVCAHINRTRSHPSILNYIILKDQITATSNLELVLQNSSILFSVLPMRALREVWSKSKKFIRKDALIISCTKAIELESYLFSSQLILEILGEDFRNQIGVLAGPSFAKELALGLSTDLVIALKSKENSYRVQSLFDHKSQNIFLSEDLIGVEICGALKNVMAIKAGLNDAQNLGCNAKASLLTGAIKEIGALLKQMGGDSHTLLGPAGLGDLALSCYGNLSRNYQAGMMLGQGRVLNEITETLGHTPEGIDTTRSIFDLCEKYKVTMPISMSVYKRLFA